MSTATEKKPAAKKASKTPAKSMAKKPAAGEPKVIRIQLKMIRIDGGTQQREKISDETVSRYQLSYSEGVELPPIRAVFDGVNYWLWEGFHRYFSQRNLEYEFVSCEVRPGTQRDAVFLSTTANRDNALQRSNGDIKKAVETLLKDPEWSKMSDREVSRHVLCTHAYVGTIRKKLEAAQLDTVSSETPATPAVRTFTKTDGTKSKMKTAGITKANAARGKAAADTAEQDEPAVGIPANPKAGGVHDNWPAEMLSDIDARKALTFASEKWAAEVWPAFWKAVLEDKQGNRLIATLLLHLGDVGGAVSRVDYSDFAGCDQVLARPDIAESITNAIGCQSGGLQYLARGMLQEGMGEDMNVFIEAAHAPLLAQLAAGWGVELPPRPMLKDYQPASPEDESRPIDGRPKPKLGGALYTADELGLAIDKELLSRVCKPSMPGPVNPRKRGSHPTPGVVPVVFIRGFPYWCIGTSSSPGGQLDGNFRPLYDEAAWGDRPAALEWENLDWKSLGYGTGVICAGADKKRYVVGPIHEMITVTVVAGNGRASDAGSSAADFKEPEIYAAEQAGLTLEDIEKADASDAIANCKDMYAKVRSVEVQMSLKRWVVLGTTMVLGRSCWRLHVLTKVTKKDLHTKAAVEAAKNDKWDGIGVIDLADKKTRHRIDADPFDAELNTIYIRAAGTT